MNSEALLNHPELIRKGIFSTREAETILGIKQGKLHPILFRLVRKGKLVRIKRGLFCLQPPGTKTSKEGYPYQGYLIAKALAGSLPYFISHYSAMHLHGMTGESIHTVFMSLSSQQRLPQDLRIPMRLVTLPQNRFWGLEEKWITHEEKVWISDPERTLLDAADRPELCGGITEIARALWLVRKKIHVKKLVKYAKRFDSRAAAKRLGFLLALVSIDDGRPRHELMLWARGSKSYVLLDPSLKKKGPCLAAWRLILNQSQEEIRRNLMT